eukprot:XP_001699248.1 predicted protein [Chlamydomonas reinhardtii]
MCAASNALGDRRRVTPTPHTLRVKPTGALNMLVAFVLLLLTTTTQPGAGSTLQARSGAAYGSDTFEYLIGSYMTGKFAPLYVPGTFHSLSLTYRTTIPDVVLFLYNCEVQLNRTEPFVTTQQRPATFTYTTSTTLTLTPADCGWPAGDAFTEFYFYVNYEGYYGNGVRELLIATAATPVPSSTNGRRLDHYGITHGHTCVGGEDVAINSSRRVIAVPPSSARGLILLHPAAVPVFTAATVGGGGALPLPNSTAPVIASARVGRLDGRLVAFGTEAMLTSCCGQAAVGFDASELGKVIVNAAQWAAAAAGAAATRKGHLLELSAFARGGHERCDVYVVLGADPQQRYNAKIKGALRDFVEKGKGVLLAGPPVVAGVDAAAVMLAAAAPVPSDEWTRPYLMFAKQNGITAGGAASAVTLDRVASEQFRAALSRLLRIKDQQQASNASAEFASLKARVMGVRADLDASDIAEFDEVLRARIAEYDRDLGAL